MRAFCRAAWCDRMIPLLWWLPWPEPVTHKTGERFAPPGAPWIPAYAAKAEARRFRGMLFRPPADRRAANHSSERRAVSAEEPDNARPKRFPAAAENRAADCDGRPERHTDGAPNQCRESRGEFRRSRPAPRHRLRPRARGSRSTQPDAAERLANSSTAFHPGAN